MKRESIVRHIFYSSLIVLAGAGMLQAQEKSQAVAPASVPVSVVVSVEAKHGKEIPGLSMQDVRVLQGHSQLQVTDWLPLQADRAELQLFILFDEATDPNVGLQIDDLKKFISGQPETTSIGIGYMRDGIVDVAQNLTKDHAQAAKAIRLTIGDPRIMGSPYLSLIDLMKRWPQSPVRREIFMVSSGIDPLQPGQQDTYLLEAIDRAEREGIQVYTIYASSAGHFGHAFYRFYWGQNNLSRLADETGGEAYFQGFDTPISFGPYLDQFADRLRHQYRITYLAKAEKKGGYQHVKITTEVPNAEIVTPDKIYVPVVK